MTKIRHLETDGVDDVALFRLAEPVKAPHIELADTDPRKGSVVLDSGSRGRVAFRRFFGCVPNEP
ncbi:hypothetical protein [Streptomyces guryensis]|uniref:Uncharacterized protein n=1 Tax=Streptomyces guryensis TaxID=2886947 RepID=A0A9Q3VPF8_9ACTN|nr:hypothetical protein [Streptomyces guryensis]MCD9874701.1 hypothetical protein [Streptomyces guryensis]